jgi:hypothetical protein
MTYGSPPQLSGVVLPRPSSVTENPEQFGSSVTLANGSERRYDGGERSVFELTWNRITEEVLAVIAAAARPTVTSYVHSDGVSYVVLPSSVQRSPIAATDPVRFSASLTLREQGPRR